jgi:hypothetical protein
MLQMQVNFVQYTDAKGRLRGLWYNQDTSKSGQDCCLAHSSSWIQSVAALGDMPFQGAEDPRITGCTSIGKW